MKKIGIISDTHSFWDEKYLHYFEPCDEIWHAGDIGSVEVAERLAAFRPLRAVCGNCDGGDLEADVPRGASMEMRGGGRADEAYRRLSGKI